jgi:ketosteroid isomerase-like protein
MTACLKVALGVALCGGIVACAKAAEEPRHDPVADKVAIDAVRNREMSALNSGITDSAIAIYTDDARVMPNQGPAVTGSAAIRAWLDTSFSQVTMTGRVTSSSVEVSGDLAVDHYAGELTVTFKAPGPKPITEGIKGINVYRRQADGSWKITKSIWNSDGRPPEPTK